MFLNIILTLLLVGQIILQALTPITASLSQKPVLSEESGLSVAAVERGCPCQTAEEKPQLPPEAGPSSAEKADLSPAEVEQAVRIEKESVLELSARSVLVEDVKTRNVLFEKNADQILPMASLTKLMTALVLLESDSDWQKIVRMEEEDEDEEGVRLKASRGEEIGFEDLFYAMLIRSCNNAAKALVRASKFSYEEFIEKMNKKAEDLDMTDTIFLDPTGLSPGNVSTVRDLTKLTISALKNYKIQQALTKKEYIFKTLGPNSRTIRLGSTNELLVSFLNGGSYLIIGGKTGYLDEAGYCLSLEVAKDDHQIVLILLGSESKTARWQEAKEIVSWIFENYD